MTQAEQVHEFLSQPYRSVINHFELSFHLDTDTNGCMDIKHLVTDKITHIPFKIEYTGNQVIMKADKVVAYLYKGEEIAGINKPLGEAVYYLTQEVLDIKN